MDLLQRKLYFSKDPEGVQHFPGGGGGGGATFSRRGPHANFNRKPYNSQFPGGGGGCPAQYPPSGSTHGL